MNKVPVRVDGRFRLGEVLGSGSYDPLILYHLAVVYSAWNIINDDHVALKLETVVEHSSSLEREYWILKQLEGGVGIPRTLWFSRESAYHALVLELLGPSLHQLFLANNQRFSLLNIVNLGVQLLSRLEYIHSHNYIHGDIKPQNILVGLGNLRHTAFIINFGITKIILIIVGLGQISVISHIPLQINDNVSRPTIGQQGMSPLSTLLKYSLLVFTTFYQSQPGWLEALGDLARYHMAMAAMVTNNQLKGLALTTDAVSKAAVASADGGTCDSQEQVADERQIIF
ncbi:kinase-like domain-containing protein [Suillus ampliporus]|nr:kinase-like domain-containing protein [Suillus ampliporus]